MQQNSPAMRIMHPTHEEKASITLASLCQSSLNNNSYQNYYPLEENKKQI